MTYNTSAKIGALTLKVLNQKGETVELMVEDVPVEVEAYFTPGDPGIHTYPNGDPGYPATGPTIEVKKVIASVNVRLWDGEYDNSISVTIEAGQDIMAMLSRDQIATLEETIDEPEMDPV